jgi:hypothetical protein
MRRVAISALAAIKVEVAAAAAYLGLWDVCRARRKGRQGKCRQRSQVKAGVKAVVKAKAKAEVAAEVAAKV